MSNLRNLLSVVAAGALLAACTGPDIGMLQTMPVKGTAFDTALHAGYVKLAKDEADEYDIADADYFADKARRAADGENVKPDRVGDRKVPEKYAAEIEAAWRDLITMRSGAARTKMPEMLAEAQTQYDCWIQEAEEDIQRIDISRCQIGFNAAMAELKNGMKAKPAPAPMEKAEEAKESFLVYFAFDSAALSAEATATIAKAAVAASNGRKALFVLGHTDKAGSDGYNRQLADRRAEAVIAELRANGIKGAISKVVAGERDPAMRTADGVREGKNRRVEVAILH